MRTFEISIKTRNTLYLNIDDVFVMREIEQTYVHINNINSVFFCLIICKFFQMVWYHLSNLSILPPPLSQPFSCLRHIEDLP